MGGSPGGGGGSSSGRIDYPGYIKHVHSDWLAGITDPTGGADTHDAIESSVTEVMNTALGSSPFTGLSAYDPDTALAVMDAAVLAATVDFGTVITSRMYGIVSSAVSVIDPITDFNDALVSVTNQVNTTLYSTAEVDADINAFGDLVDDQIDAVVLPRFRRGMQDINAVQSSAFVIGEALIEEGRNMEVA